MLPLSLGDTGEPASTQQSFSSASPCQCLLFLIGTNLLCLFIWIFEAGLRTALAKKLCSQPTCQQSREASSAEAINATAANAYEAADVQVTIDNQGMLKAVHLVSMAGAADTSSMPAPISYSALPSSQVPGPLCLALMCMMLLGHDLQHC